MDDFLDREIDMSGQRPSLFTLMGDATFPYSILSFALACAFDARIACPLMLGIYATGMISENGARYPSGLTAYLEVALTILFSLLFFGFRLTFASVFLMIALQLVDDLVDYSKERDVGSRNLVRLLGKGEAFLLSICLLLAGWIADRKITCLVVIGAPIVMLLVSLLCRRARSRGAIDL
ncbi:MAG TPA: hypothetical protein GX509_06635 [Firmicutes bacterium]|nr:hypothetical protein [Bacillota bacterium]